MESTGGIPLCPIPTETISDIIPLLVISGLFLLGGWWYRRWRSRRRPPK